MPFISNKERQSLIKNVNTKYTLRKVCILVTILVFLFVLALVISIALGWILGFNKLHSEGMTTQQVWIEMCKNWWSPFIVEMTQAQTLKVSLGWISYFVIVLLVIGLVGSVGSIVLTFTIKSPKDVKEDIKVLESSPLAGKSIKDLSPVEVVKQRRTPNECHNDEQEKGDKK